MSANAADPGIAVPAADSAATTRALLGCAVLAGPVFAAVTLAQTAARGGGYDPKIHPLSMLSLGELGWIQIANFVLCGLLAVAGSFGIRRSLRARPAGTWGPILFAVYGISLVWGGVFVADPAFGYPAGTPEGAPEQLSWHGMLHGFAPAVSGVAVIVLCFVFARRYVRLGRRGWAAYCWSAVAVDLALTGASIALGDFRYMLAGGVYVWVWTAAIAWDLLRQRSEQDEPSRTASTSGA
ncbi:MAG: DUF998 domain-containing protein [Stackebrandtia sp.]